MDRLVPRDHREKVALFRHSLIGELACRDLGRGERLAHLRRLRAERVRPSCSGRMKLIAMVTDPKSVRAYLRGVGEACDVPERSPSRRPPHWRSTGLRRKALGDVA